MAQPHIGTPRSENKREPLAVSLQMCILGTERSDHPRRVRVYRRCGDVRSEWCNSKQGAKDGAQREEVRGRYLKDEDVI